MKIKYVKMPISIQEKKEFNKQGFRIIDAKFDPSPVQEEKPKAKAKPRAKKA
jgi:hypothetical protein